ncbi:hypothetical protein ACSLBF_10895 [Pseudoalteromonas sp. T1lg65]|uniref:hypothetical protein n=1 Tax=Pseudoalteromonas sp. T1lg65 TaxID=2077101 RepID=UPI003F797539
MERLHNIYSILLLSKLKACFPNAYDFKTQSLPIPEADESIFHQVLRTHLDAGLIRAESESSYALTQEALSLF